MSIAKDCFDDDVELNRTNVEEKIEFTDYPDGSGWWDLSCIDLADRYPNGDEYCAANHTLGQHCRKSCGNCAGK